MCLIIEVIYGFNGDVLRGILELEKRVFPSDWQFEDAENYFKEKLENPRNVNIVMKDECGGIVGYAMSVPYSDALIEIAEDDPEMLAIEDCYYIEAFELDPENQKFKTFSPLLEKLIDESIKRGAKKLSMHARVSVGASSIIRKRFKGKIVIARRIDNWVNYAGKEPTDYIVVDCF
ncbi:MAG: GNAT family N-acetyltransferase [Candidatus Moranbacteria bacterium]|jgi:hypothetical protein|nr:GNAT family N-acetyltransferase [Candidatus Moranbacteria bacterium]